MAAIAPFDDDYRKQICEQGVLAEIILSMEPFGAQSSGADHRGKRDRQFDFNDPGRLWSGASIDKVCHCAPDEAGGCGGGKDCHQAYEQHGSGSEDRSNQGTHES